MGKSPGFHDEMHLWDQTFWQNQVNNFANFRERFDDVAASHVQNDPKYTSIIRHIRQHAKSNSIFVVRQPQNVKQNRNLPSAVVKTLNLKCACQNEIRS